MERQEEQHFSLQTHYTGTSAWLHCYKSGPCPRFFGGALSLELVLDPYLASGHDISLFMFGASSVFNQMQAASFTSSVIHSLRASGGKRRLSGKRCAGSCHFWHQRRCSLLQFILRAVSASCFSPEKACCSSFVERSRLQSFVFFRRNLNPAQR